MHAAAGKTGAADRGASAKRENNGRSRRSEHDMVSLLVNDMVSLLENFGGVCSTIVRNSYLNDLIWHVDATCA